MALAAIVSVDQYVVVDLIGRDGALSTKTLAGDYRLDTEVHVKVVKKTQEERPSAGDIADLAALPRDSGDVKALYSNALRSAGSLRAANPDTLNSRSSFATTRQMGPQQSGCRAVLPAPLARMLDVSFQLPYKGTPSDGEVP